MRVRRVIVGLDAAAPLNRAALESAAVLARRIEAELVGLFIENVELLNLAGLPFTREVDLLSATTRELDVARMERSLRLLARDAERMLAAVAGSGTLRWSFRVTRGSVPAELIAAAAEADLLLACAARTRTAGTKPRLRLVPERSVAAVRAALADDRGGILVLTGDGDGIVAELLRELSAQEPAVRPDPAARQAPAGAGDRRG